MCLYVKKTGLAKLIQNKVLIKYKILHPLFIRVAKEDITVYKWLEGKGNSLVTPYMGTAVEPRQLMTTPDFTLSGQAWIIVNRGIHAFREYATAWRNGGDQIYKCTIPKGSRYIIGDGQEIVSTNLIIGERITEEEHNELYPKY